MKLLIKQRVFSWADAYDIYDENGDVRYHIQSKLFTLGHQLRVYNAWGQEIGSIRQRLWTLLPKFDLIVGDQPAGTVCRRFSLFRPVYEVEMQNWTVTGNLWGWDYDVFSGTRPVMHIHKELLHWGDTYVLDIVDPADECPALMLAIAIDAANCSSSSD